MQQLPHSLCTCHLQSEVQLNTLKTDHAKLTGSYHALVTIKDKFSTENSKLCSRNRELQIGNQVLMEDKKFLLRKVDDLSRDCLHLSASQQAVNVSTYINTVLVSTEHAHITYH